MNDQEVSPPDDTTLSDTAESFTSFASLRAAHTDLLKRHRECGDTPEFVAEAEAFIRQGRATGMLLDAENDRWAAQGLLDYWSTLLYRVGRELPDATLADFNPDLAPELDDALCPYLGLDAFGEANREVFFGRGRLVGEMVRRLQEERLLAVVGPSGSGKSSVVLAGLLPAIKAGALPDSQHWHYYRPVVPGSEPMLNLARVLRPADIAAGEWDQPQAERLQHNPGELARLANEWGVPTALIVDQFEELFTLCHDDQVRQAFIDNLRGLIQTPEARHTVILTMRIDFEPRVARLPVFYPVYEKAVVRVTPLSAGELRETIEEPARLVGLKYEAGIVDALVQDILGESAALPLLQFTLLKLWEERERNRLTWEAYHRLGGARQALAHSADEFYEKLIPQYKMTARRILLRMVRPGEGLEVTSRRIRREALYQAAEARDWVDRVLDKLIQARLVRLTQGETTADDQVEVAHEALVRNWPRLVGWLEEEREDLRRRLRLTTAAEQWEEHGRDVGALLRGRLLEEAESYPDLNALESEFVEASRAAEEQTKREREEARSARRRARMATVLAIVSVLAIVAVILAVIAGRRAQFNAKFATSRQLAAEATAMLDEDPQLSLLLAVEAVRVIYTTEAERSLRQALQAWQVIAILRSHTGGVNALAFSADGSWLATGSADGKARLWKTDSLEEPRTPMRHEDSVTAVAFSSNTGWLATGSADGTARLWKIAGPEAEPIILKAHEKKINALAFSPDDRWLITASADNTARIWDTRNPLAETIILSGHTDNVSAVALSPGGDRIATASLDGTARLWELEKGEKLAVEELAVLKGHTSGVNALAFSPDGQLLATASTDGSARLWEAVTGGPVAILRGHRDSVICLAFSPDGSLLVTGSADTTARRWDVSSAKEIDVLGGHGDRVNAVAFSSDGRLLATASADGTASAWDAETGELKKNLRGHTANINVVAFSPECASPPEVAAKRCETLLATASSDSTVRLWNVVGGEAQTVSLPPKGTASSVGFNFDGSGGILLATGDESGTIRFRKEVVAPLSPDDKAIERIGSIESGGSLKRLTFSPDGSLLATGHDDGVVRLWSVPTASDQDGDRAPLAELRGHNGYVYGLAFSPDGRLLATAAEDGTDPRLWDVSDVLEGEGEARQIAILKGHKGDAFGVAFSPDGKLLATSGFEDTTVRLWDVSSALDWSDSVTEIATLQSDEALTFLAFSPDNRLLAAGSEDGPVHVWDVSKVPSMHSVDQKVAVLLGHGDTVTVVAFSPDDGRLLATGSTDGTVRVWDVLAAKTAGGSGSQVRFFRAHESSVDKVAFSLDGRWLVTASDDGTVQPWPMGIDVLMSSACDHAVRNLTWTEWETYLAKRKTYFGREKPYRRTCQDQPLHPSVVDRMLTKAHEYVRQGMYRQALDAVDQLLKLDPTLGLVPKRVVAWMLVEQGREFAQQGKYVRAQAVLRQAVELHPELKTTRAQDLAWINYDICRNSGPFSLSKVVGPACQQARDLAGQISFGETVTATLETGSSHLWTFKATAGQVVSIDVGQDQGELDCDLTLYGPNGIRLGRDDGSGPGYNSRLDPIVLAEAGIHFIAAGGFGDSVGAYRLTLGLEPVPVSVAAKMLVEQGRTYTQHAEYEPALAALRRAVQLDPSLNLVPEAEVALAQGRAYVQKEEYKQAQAALRRALELDPSLNLIPEAEVARMIAEEGRAYAQRGEYEQALAALRRAVQLDPTLNLVPEAEVARVLVEQGRAYVQQEEYGLALAILRRALELDPSLNVVPEAEVALARGRAYVRRGEYEQALAALRQAVKLDPTLNLIPEAEVALAQGRAHVQQGQYEQALDVLRQAVKLDSSLDLLPEAEVARMLVEQAPEYALQEQYEQALVALDRAVELDPELEQTAQRIEFEIRVGSLGPLVAKGDNQAAEEAIQAALDLSQSDLGGANGTWNNLCWWASLCGFAGQVVDGACERAVELADAEYVASSRDGRGLARALSGDVPGAIDDFTFFVEWGKENGQYLEYLPTREEWIIELEAGRNPFDEATLEALKFE